MIIQDAIDLYLQAAVEGQIEELPGELVVPLELHLMDCVAIKKAGGEHMVHWDAAGEYQ